MMPVQRVTRVVRLAAISMVVGVAAALSGACDSPAPRPDATAAPPTPTVVSVSPTAPVPSGSGTSGTSADATTTAGWSTDPVVRDRTVSVPPVPVVVHVRSATHAAEGYDRVVLDITGALPGYQVRYIDHPVMDGSGRAATVPGRRYLQIRLEPAMAHAEDGTALAPRTTTVNYPMLKGWTITGDFEGVVTIVLGLDDVVGFRVGELSGPRVFIDVAN